MVCGLGNPGNEYKNTRHNVGYMVIDSIITNEKLRFLPGKGDYIYGELICGESRLLLLKPQTFMNLSGIPLLEAKKFFNVLNENLLVVLDDINLPFGKIRLRKSGSDGGHKGLASTIYHLSTEDFPRLRIGIGRPEMDKPLSEYVLLNFSEDERKELPTIIENVLHSIEVWSTMGIEKAMNITNSEAL